MSSSSSKSCRRQRMIRRVEVRHFKRFGTEVFELADQIVLAGPNNAGKTSLVQAINTWHFALRKWIAEKFRENTKARTEEGDETGTAKSRSGVPITRKEFS